MLKCEAQEKDKSKERFINLNNHSRKLTFDIFELTIPIKAKN